MSVFVGDGTTGVEARADRLGLPTGTTDPATAEAGDMFYNTDTSKIRVYDGTAWADLASGGGGGASTTGIQLTNSVRLEAADSSYYSYQPSSGGNAQRFTLSFWAKVNRIENAVSYFCEGGGVDSQSGRFYLRLYQTANTNGLVVGSGGANFLVTSAYFRDSTAWYHIVVAVDTSQVTSSDRVKLYVNGDLVTNFVSTSYPGQGDSLGWGRVNENHSIGRTHIDGGNYFNGYITDFYYIDDSQLLPTAFGTTDSTTGAWVPTSYTGTYGTRDYHLTFENTTSANTMGYDQSGNNNNWTGVNINRASGYNDDAVLDVPFTSAGGSNPGNYCVFSDQMRFPGSPSVLDAGTRVSMGGGSYGYNGSIAVQSGKWYWEGVGSGTTNGFVGGRFGVAEVDCSQSGESANEERYNIHWHPGGAYGVREVFDGTQTENVISATYADGDVLAFALDMDNSILYAYKNNSLQGSYDFSSKFPVGSRWLAPTNGNGSSGTPSFNYRFGADGFTYSPPAGYLALNTANLPTPSVTKPKEYFGIVTWTGDGTTGRNIVTTTEPPDFVWIKNRTNPTSDTIGHRLFDTARGVGKVISSNGTGIESTDTNMLSGFTSNGFQIGNELSVNSTTGGTHTYIAWTWKAGGAPTASNTSKSQTPPSGSRMIDGVASTSNYASAGTYPLKMTTSTAADFSIVYYEGTGANTTVPHGLSGKPDLVIWKALDDTYNWDVYHSGAGYQKTLILNSSGPSRNVLHADATTTTLPVTHQYTGGSANGKRMVAYCWKEKPGFSRIGWYYGNGNAEGQFVFCGFKPAFIATKIVDGTESSGSGWRCADNVRSPYQGATSAIMLGNSIAEQTSWNTAEFYSNGFKWRTDDVNLNQDGVKYIFFAFAEMPQKYATGV